MDQTQVRLEKRLLNHLGRIIPIPQYAERKPHGLPLVQQHQPVEGRLVSRLAGSHQSDDFILLRVHIVHPTAFLPT